MEHSQRPEKHRSEPDRPREEPSELHATSCASLLRRVLLPSPPPPLAPLKPSPSSYGACHRSYCLVNDTLPGLAFSFFGKWLQCRSVSSSVFTVPIKSLFSRNSSRHLCVSPRRPPPRPPCATLWHGSDRTKGAMTPLPNKGLFFYDRLPVKSSASPRVQTRCST